MEPPKVVSCVVEVLNPENPRPVTFMDNYGGALLIGGTVAVILIIALGVVLFHYVDKLSIGWAEKARTLEAQNKFLQKQLDNFTAKGSI
jgi:uncharacterized protein HemX